MRHASRYRPAARRGRAPRAAPARPRAERASVTRPRRPTARSAGAGARRARRRASSSSARAARGRAAGPPRTARGRARPASSALDASAAARARAGRRDARALVDEDELGVGTSHSQRASPPRQLGLDRSAPRRSPRARRATSSAQTPTGSRSVASVVQTANVEAPVGERPRLAARRRRARPTCARVKRAPRRAARAGASSSTQSARANGAPRRADLEHLRVVGERRGDALDGLRQHAPQVLR